MQELVTLKAGMENTFSDALTRDSLLCREIEEKALSFKPRLLYPWRYGEVGPSFWGPALMV